MLNVNISNSENSSLVQRLNPADVTASSQTSAPKKGRDPKNQPPQAKLGKPVVDVIDLATFAGAIAVSASFYDIIPKFPQPKGSSATQVRADVERFSAQLKIKPPKMQITTSTPWSAAYAPGALGLQIPIFDLRLIIISERLVQLFSQDELSCLVAHEVAHFCESGSGDECSTPVPMRFSWRDAPHIREHKADYLGALLCGEEAMERLLGKYTLIRGFDPEKKSSSHPKLVERQAFIRLAPSEASLCTVKEKAGATVQTFGLLSAGILSASLFKLMGSYREGNLWTAQGARLGLMVVVAGTSVACLAHSA